MGNFNKVFLLGNLTRDPEVKSTPSGQVVTALGLAVNRTYYVGGQDGQGGEKREDTAFVDIDFWGKKGETIAQYLKKGDPIFVEGRLNFRSWEDKDGNKRNKLDVTGENFQFVGGRQGEGRSDTQTIGPRESAGMPEPAGGDGGEFDEVPF